METPLCQPALYRVGLREALSIKALTEGGAEALLEMTPSFPL